MQGYMVLCVCIVEMTCSPVDLWRDWIESVMELAEEAGTFPAAVDRRGPCTKNDSLNNGLSACFPILFFHFRFII